MAYHPYSGRLKNPFDSVVNDDDEFGDFTSANVYPSLETGSNIGVQMAAPMVPLAPVVPAVQNGGVFFNPIPDAISDDEFGDFCGPTIPVQTETQAPKVPVHIEQQFQSKPVQPPVKCQPNYDIDLETDLETVTHLPWNGTHDAETGIQNLRIIEEPDLFDSAALASTVSAVAEPVKTLEDVFALDCTIEAPVLQPFADSENAGSLTDDEFGDFAQADVSPTQESLFASLTGNPSEEALKNTATSLEAPEFQSVKLPTEPEPPKLVSDPVVSSITIQEAHDDLFGTGDADPTFTAFSEVTVEPVSVCWDDPLPPLDIVDPVVVPVIADDSQPAFPDEDLFQTVVEGEKAEEPLAEDTQHRINSEESTLATVNNEDEEDEFGDFADFQGAVAEQRAEKNPRGEPAREKEDDDFGDFDDFATAPPVSNESVPPVGQPLTPENQIQRMLSSVFPLDSDVSTDSQANRISTAPPGALWSYVSQVDSTPALSFSWKHSSAQQRFLQALRIDSIFQLQTKKPSGNRWTPTSNHMSQPTSLPSTTDRSAERPNVTLDLDFFMAGAASTPNTASNSLLESIERELLASPTAPPSQPASLTTQPSLSENELSDFFGHMQLEPGTPVSRQRVVDLLQ